MLDQITPLIIAYNEAPNIARTVDRLVWAGRIVVVDSGSNDGTLEILRRYPQVEVFPHPFRDFAEQCNYGLAQVETRWALSLDADYELSNSFPLELGALRPDENIAGYGAEFVDRVNGRPLRGSLYPGWTVLFRTDRARYVMDGHAHVLAVAGAVARLSSVIYHDDRKPLSRWLISQQRYAKDEAAFLLTREDKPMARVDRLRLMVWPAPFAVLFYTLFVKGCLLDGWPGWFYALQRLLSETMLALELIDRRLREAHPAAATDGREMPPADSSDHPQKSRELS